MSSVKNFFLIGLIGPLGSGKSTVRQMLEQLGARSLDADLLAHVVMQRGTRTWRAIVNAFGVEILTHDGRIDRRKLGARVFADPAALQTLESIVHPAVLTLIKDILRDNQHPVVVLEAIKLFETGMDQWCDALWAVTCSPDKQVERVMRARHLNADQVRERLAAQGSFEDKLRRADVTIDNSGDLATTRAQVLKLWRAIRPETARDKSEWLGETARPVSPPAAPVIAVPPSPPVEPQVSAPPPSVSTVETIVAPPPVEPTIVSPPVVPTEAVVAPTPTPVVPPSTPSEVEVRRSRRSDLDALAVAIAKRENLARPLSHAEALRRFGSGGYRIAVADGRIVAFAAWEVENLVAMMRELWAESNYVALLALPRLFDLIEEEARQLLCEVSIIFLEVSAPLYLSEQARACGYRQTEVANLHTIWQPIVRERLRPGERLWAKQLRADIITKPF
ncbi:MAG: dephospho-CoA kinase [Anaerolineae bacterium]|nr:dephospho-CoA kinase [Anaerolineae bacterium]